MFQKFTIIFAWASIAMVFYATVTDVNFVYSLYFRLSPLLLQPDMRSFARFEHVIAFACLGALFCFAYPDRIVSVSCALFMTVVSLEYLQTWTADRHGTVVDACEKIAGGILGILAVHAISYLARRRQSRRAGIE
jgi:hypothetical protein